MVETQGRPDELDLRRYWEVLLRRRWVVLSVGIAVLLATVLVAFSTRPVYQASALLVIEKERGEGGAVYSPGTMVESSHEDYYQTQYKLLKSHSLLREVYGKLHLDQEPDFSQPQGLEKLQKAITIFPVLRSRLVYVRVESHDRALAARVANALSETFVAQNLSNQLFISKDILQTLQLKGGDPNTRRLYEALPAVVNNPLIQSLKGDYIKLQTQMAEMSQKYTKKYPAMAALESSSAALKNHIDTETDRVVQSLKTQLSGQFQGNNVRIIDPATPPQFPIKPKKGLALLLGLAGGLLAGFGAALLLERLDETLRTQEDVEKKLGMPFLGLIPYCAGNPERVYESLLASAPSLSSEAMRNLRTMVDFACVSQRSRSMVVTSALQEEGKSYVASNLGVVFAQMGEKVLLIDGDLRRPRLHKNFGLSSERGLSEYLAASADVEEAAGFLRPTGIENLTVLGCGKRPPNPSELLNTPRLSALIAWAEERFDRVIIDCTPMFPISDTMLWGRYVRSAAMVVRYAKTRTPLIQSACRKLQQGGVKILGLAINGGTRGGLAYSSYGYYYQQYYRQYQEDLAKTA